ncbi:hypothetical protein GCM10027516_15460 [Niabella aquatica]
MALTLLLLPAAARVTIPADTTKEVVLYLVTDSIPGGAIVLGDFKIGDNGFTSDCQYQRVIEKAKQKAAKAGGNAIKITELKEPDIWSSCYRIKGKILQIDAEAYAEKVVQSNTYINDDEDDVATDASAGYALLYLYRPKNFSGSAIGYDIYLDDSVICRMTNNSKYEIKVYKPGQHKIWAKTEAKAIVPLNIKPGKSYYIKCGIQTGFWVGQPQLNLVYPTQGKEEYEQMKGRGEKKK